VHHRNLRPRVVPPETTEIALFVGMKETCAAGNSFQLTATATRPTKRPTRLRLGLHPALMRGDPRLGVRFGFECGDLGRMTVRDVDLDPE
jgi:hypothetical protein